LKFILVCFCWTPIFSTFRCFLVLSLDIVFALISLQAAATKAIFKAAMKGEEELVKKCIAEGANVDEFRDEVIEAGYVSI